MYLEFLARIVLSASMCQVVLHLLSPILFCQCGHLSLYSLRVVSLPRQMRPGRMSIRHPLLVPKFQRHISCTSLNSSTFPLAVSATLSLYVLTLAFPVQVLSMIVLIRSRHSLLCGLIALSCDASAAQPGQPPV